MAIVFPINPNDNDTFTAANGSTYIYNAAKGLWAVQTTASAAIAASISDNAPSSPVEGQQWFNTSTLKTYVYYSGQWLISNPIGLQGPTGPSGADGTDGADGEGGGTTTYADIDALVAETGMSDGDMAFVTSTNNLYIYKTNGWFKIATVENLQPGSISGIESEYTLADDGTPTVITATATDPEGFPLTWSYAVTTGALGSTATVSQADNVFTITPSTTEADEGSFSITFSVTDGVNGAVNAVSDFTLSFGWAVDVSNITYDNVSGSITQSDPVGFDMSADGTTVIVCSFGTNDVYQYSLSTPYDISTMSYQYSGDMTPISSQTVDVKFSPDGTKLYASSNNVVPKGFHQYTLSTPWDVGSISYDNVSLIINQTPSYAGDLLYDLQFNTDGTKAFVFNPANDKVYEYTLPTPYNLSGATNINITAAFTALDSDPLGALFSGDGKKMYISGYVTDRIYQHTLTNPFDTSSFTYDNVSFDFSGQSDQMRNIIFKSDGTKMYVLDYVADRIYQYSTGL